MLKSLAEFSKVIAKYAYYPMLIGFISIVSAFVYSGTSFSYLGLVLAVICLLLSLLAAFSKKLCAKAGIDDKIR